MELKKGKGAYYDERSKVLVGGAYVSEARDCLDVTKDFEVFVEQRERITFDYFTKDFKTKGSFIEDNLRNILYKSEEIRVCEEYNSSGLNFEANNNSVYSKSYSKNKTIKITPNPSEIINFFEHNLDKIFFLNMVKDIKIEIKRKKYNSKFTCIWNYNDKLKKFSDIIKCNQDNEKLFLLNINNNKYNYSNTYGNVNEGNIKDYYGDSIYVSHGVCEKF